MLGPLLGFGLLQLLPGAFDAVFVVSFFVAAVGLGILLLFVREGAAADEPTQTQPRPTFRAAVGLLTVPRFRALVLIGAALSVATVWLCSES